MKNDEFKIGDLVQIDFSEDDITKPLLTKLS